MLTDHWVIAQLVTQLLSAILLAGLALPAYQMLRFWVAESATDGQLLLERKTYLVASIVQFVLVFQIASLVMFLVTVNNHLPGVIKGAMCATGVLDVNAYGYPLLWIKMIGVFVYAAYLMLHYLDEAEPAYPLTPAKYWLLFPAIALVWTDFVLLTKFFANIDPDIIATCCSVAFVGSGGSGVLLGESALFGNQVLLSLFFAGFLGVVATIFFAWHRPVLVLLPALIYVFSAGYALRYFFVKYIYGLPSHLCIFDIFWEKYHFVGFIIFGAYFGLLLALLWHWLYAMARPHLGVSHSKGQRQAKYWALSMAFVSFLVPVAYWLAWNGEL